MSYIGHIKLENWKKKRNLGGRQSKVFGMYFDDHFLHSSSISNIVKCRAFNPHEESFEEEPPDQRP